MPATSSTTGTPTISNPQQMHCQIKAQIAMLLAKVGTHMLKSQTGHKSDYDGRVLETLLFQASNYVFVDKPLLVTTQGSSVNALASNTYNQLQRRISGPYRILKVQANTVTVEKYGVLNTVSTARVPHVPVPRTDRRRNRTPYDVQQKTKVKTHNANPAKMTLLKASNTSVYVIDKRTGHFGRGCHARNVVRWYGYEPTENPV